MEFTIATGREASPSTGRFPEESGIWPVHDLKTFQSTKAMNILNYILGGKSTFTVVSARTGDRMTYRVTAVPRHPQAIKVANWYWVSVRTGGEKNWTYMGMIFDDCKFKRTAKSKISEGTQEFAG